MGIDVEPRDAGAAEDAGTSDADLPDSGFDPADRCGELCDASEISECTTQAELQCLSACESAVEGVPDSCATCVLNEATPIGRFCMVGGSCTCTGGMFPDPDTSACSQSCL